MAADPKDTLRPPAPSRAAVWKSLLILLLLLGAGAFTWWWSARPPAPATHTPSATALPASASPPAVAAPTRAILYPVASAASVPASAAGPDAAAASPPDLNASLRQLLGREAVLSLLQTDRFAQRFVATVDNLGRSHAPSALWPVNPTPGRFQVLERDGQTTINPDNGLRYTPLVLLLENLPVRRTMAIYVQFYPQLQQAYQDLGFAQGYFNDRLVQVMDQLLATPPAAADTRLHLTEVKGPIPSARPWVRYEFVDPQLEALTAGQKMMLRIGPVNQRRLKAKLVEFRQALVQLGAGAGAG